jgi:NAD(P)-dependent dehydrogenase (short-subunit alcohol dehydrogenase family)
VGRVVLVSSVAAFTGGIVGPHYTASKAALIGLARSLAGPLALYGVTVNAVAPALIKRGETLPGDEESREQLAARVPVGSDAPRRSRRSYTRSSRTRLSRLKRSPWTAGCTPANRFNTLSRKPAARPGRRSQAQNYFGRGVVSSCR